MGSMVAGGQDCGGGRGDADRVYPARGADRPAAPARRTVRDVIPVCGRTSDGNTMRYGGGSHAAGGMRSSARGKGACIETVTAINRRGRRSGHAGVHRTGRDRNEGRRPGDAAGRRRTHGHHGRGRDGLHSGAPPDRLTETGLSMAARRHTLRVAAHICRADQQLTAIGHGVLGFVTYRGRMFEGFRSVPTRRRRSQNSAMLCGLRRFPAIPRRASPDPAERFGVSPSAPGTARKARHRSRHVTRVIRSACVGVHFESPVC